MFLVLADALSHFECFLQFRVAFYFASIINTSAEKRSCQTTFGIAVYPARQPRLCTLRSLLFILSCRCQQIDVTFMRSMRVFI